MGIFFTFSGLLERCADETSPEPGVELRGGLSMSLTGDNEESPECVLCNDAGSFSTTWEERRTRKPLETNYTIHINGTNIWRTHSTL